MESQIAYEDSINPQQKNAYLCWLFAVTTMIMFRQVSIEIYTEFSFNNFSSFKMLTIVSKRQALEHLEAKLVGMRNKEMEKLLLGSQSDRHQYHGRLRHEILYVLIPRSLDAGMYQVCSGMALSSSVKS